MNLDHTGSKPRSPRAQTVPTGLWPGSSPQLIAAHERTLNLVAAEPHPEWQLRTSTSLRNVAVFAVALVVVCLSLSRGLSAWPGLGFEEESLERRKYEHFARRGDQYQAVFVGSSQVYRHIDPVLFDQQLSEGGLPLRSFNFGLPGMFMPEVLHTVDWILERKPARLKYLFVELRELAPEVVVENELSRREIQWHGWRAASLVGRLVWHSDQDLMHKLSAWRRTARHALYRFGNVSLAYPLFQELTGQRKVFRPVWKPEGFLAIDVDARRHPEDLSLRRRHRRFRNRPDVFEEYQAALVADPGDQEPTPLMRDTLAQLTARIRAAGVEPIYFLGVPGWSRHADLKQAKEEGVIPCLLALNDFHEHPEFYDRDHLYDERHLQSDGAERFTRLLAEEFLRHQKAVGNAGR